MIRLVVAAVLTLATFAAALPAIDDARATRTDAVIQETVERLERTGRSLATTEDATETAEFAATRVVELTLPSRSLTAAQPSFVAVGGPPGGPGNRSVVTYMVSSTTRRRHVPLPVPIHTPNGPVVFRDPGHHAVSLGLVSRSGGPELIVTRGPR